MPPELPLKQNKILETVSVIDVVTFPTTSYPDITWTLYGPKNQVESLPLIVFIHGGGWVSEGPLNFSTYAQFLAAQGYVVAHATYSFSPEFTYPVSTMQLLSGLDSLYQNASYYKIDNQRIFIGGDSAGAHLSSQLGALMTNPTYAQEMNVISPIPSENIKGLLLINGIYDFSIVKDVEFANMDYYLESYTGTKDYQSFEKIEEMSPQNHITSAFPPSFITAGDLDPLESQSIIFADRLEQLGVDTTTLFWKKNTKLQHEYVFNLGSTEAEEAFVEILYFLYTHS